MPYLRKVDSKVPVEIANGRELPADFSKEPMKPVLPMAMVVFVLAVT